MYQEAKGRLLTFSCPFDFDSIITMMQGITQWYGKKSLEEMDDGCSMTMMMEWILSDEVMDNVWQSANLSSYYLFKNG